MSRFLEPIERPHFIVGCLRSQAHFVVLHRVVLLRVVLHRRITEIRLLRTPGKTSDSLVIGMQSRFPDGLTAKMVTQPSSAPKIVHITARPVAVGWEASGFQHANYRVASVVAPSNVETLEPI